MSRIGSCVLKTDPRGATVRLSREEWGVVIDALIEHAASSTARKAGNSESTSDMRADICHGLISVIGRSLA